jgi:lysophospholipase L1-like esterase
MAYIFEFYRTKYPERKISLFNCGIGSDHANGVLRRLDYDVLVHEPDKAVIMLGMNDVGGDGVYGIVPVTGEILEKRRNLELTYKNNMEAIILKLLEKNIEVILTTPTPYDETAVIDAKNLVGKNESLARYGEILKEHAAKYNCHVVDFHTPMTQLNLERQKRDPQFTFTGLDRSHPQSEGCLLMSYLFLKQQGIIIEPTKLGIGYKEKSLEYCNNCKVEDLSFGNNKIMFTYKPGFLPYYLDETYTKVNQLVPLTNDFNTEILRITGIPFGKYKLLIDGKTVGIYTSDQFEYGINLALEKNNPIMEIAKRIREDNMKRFEVEQKIRTIRYVEKFAREEGVDISNFSETKAFIEKKLESWKDYRKQQANLYFRIKNEEAHLETTLDILTSGMYSQNVSSSFLVEIQIADF